jgi:hypothetical protein
MPWHGMPLHAISSPGHFQRATPCQISPSHSPDAAQPLPRRSQAPETSAHARPVAPRTRPCRARARMAFTLDAPERDDARVLAPPQPSLSAPVDARRHTEARGHGHLPSGTPCSTTTTPITRRGTAPSHQTRHRHRAPAAPRSSASASPVHQQPDEPMSCPFATLERRRRRRP